MKLVHTAIAVKNLEESFKFYTEKLGFKQARRFSPTPGMTIVYLKGDGEAMVELIEGPEKSNLTTGSGEALLLIGMEVADMNATVKDLQSKGVKFTHETITTPDGLKLAFLKDPNGVEIELVQHPKK
ncbi:MAG: VOC family protein [bacterium]